MINDFGIIWRDREYWHAPGKNEKTLDTLDGFDTDAFVILKRKLVNEIQNQESRSRRLLDIRTEEEWLVRFVWMSNELCMSVSWKHGNQDLKIESALKNEKHNERYPPQQQLAVQAETYHLVLISSVSLYLCRQYPLSPASLSWETFPVRWVHGNGV